LQQVVAGGVDLRAQIGDFPFERVGASQLIGFSGGRKNVRGGLVHGQLPCCF